MRILVVDDAVVVRKIVTDVLSEDPDIEVVGTAANGRIALGKIESLKPDLVTLDVEMPEMDGLQTLRALRKIHPNLPVIMFSTRTERGAAITIDALMFGANDYVTKPANVGSVTAAMAQVREQLIPKVKALCGRAPIERSSAARSSAERIPTARSVVTASGRPSSPAHRIDVVAIGVSTGGPKALTELFMALPAHLPVPIVVVQHLPANFSRLLAERLDSLVAIEVAEAHSSVAMKAGTALIAPGDHHLVVRRHGADVRVVTHQGPPENSCRPSVDTLFRSVAGVYGPNALGVILTGMGQDGLKGCEHISAAGGRIIVQDKSSSVVWGMPGVVARAGLADKVLPLCDIASEITHRAQLERLMPSARTRSVRL